MDLSVAASRGVYNLEISTCIGDESGISAVDMRGNVYGVIMGKMNKQSTYTTTEMTYLDHFVPGSININILGDLIAGNLFLASTANNAIYSRNIEDILIEMKLEIVRYDKTQFDCFSKPISIKINDNVLAAASRS